MSTVEGEGHLSGVFTKSGSTVHTRTYGYKVLNRHKRLEAKGD